jgi:hypothetical protein
MGIVGNVDKSYQAATDLRIPGTEVRRVAGC